MPHEGNYTEIEEGRSPPHEDAALKSAGTANTPFLNKNNSNHTNTGGPICCGVLGSALVLVGMCIAIGGGDDIDNCYRDNSDSYGCKTCPPDEKTLNLCKDQFDGVKTAGYVLFAVGALMFGCSLCIMSAIADEMKKPETELENNGP